jgi:hypothetical protein
MNIWTGTERIEYGSGPPFTLQHFKLQISRTGFQSNLQQTEHNRQQLNLARNGFPTSSYSSSATVAAPPSSVSPSAPPVVATAVPVLVPVTSSTYNPPNPLPYNPSYNPVHEQQLVAVVASTHIDDDIGNDEDHV